MRPLEKVYWLRLALGIVAAFLCVGFGIATNTITNRIGIDDGAQFNIFMNGMSLALLTYLVSYYAIKSKFKTQVQKPSKLFTTGIGIYLLSWIIFWALLYTIIAGPHP
jgi:hypothetical protein